MATMLFYDKVVPLNRDNHRDLKLSTQAGNAGFATGTHYVPLAGAEFHQAARDYPVLFAGGDDGGGPVALVGLRENENLFLDDDERWTSGTYVPAFVRRYPFVLANVAAAQDSEKGEDREYTVCIDESYAGFSSEDGRALFDDDGKETEYLNNTVTFLNQFLAEMKRTQQFVERLNDLDLLSARNLRVNDDRGRHFSLQDFRIVDEDKLAKLDDAVLGELHRDGFLGWIYAHLISIGNAARLPARLVDLGPARPAQAEVQLEDAATT